MPSCEHIAPSLCQFADGTLPLSAHPDVVRHLEQCPACARDLEEQSSVRRALSAEAGVLRGTAPDALRARVTALVSSPKTVVPFPAAARPKKTWTRLVPASLAAGVLLAAAVGAFSPAGTVLAAQLALDHLKCRAIAAVTPDADAMAVAREWEDRWGWPVTVPPTASSLGLSFVGLRNCLYHDGTMAHLMYDYRGHRLSLFVMPHSEARADALAMLGQHTETWAAGGRTYALVVDGTAGNVDEVAAYLRQAAR